VALGHAVLAALLEGEASGYELSKRFDVSVANFWSATPQQLYRELERLHAAGLLSARVVEQERRPNKRVFALTDAGRAELFAFTARPARPPAMRDELLVKLQALDAGDREAIVTALRERLESSRGKLALYERLRERMLAGRDEEDHLRTAASAGPYLTLAAGRMYERSAIEWAEWALAAIASRADVAPLASASRRGRAEPAR
jgi:DNA-binding PadR family transcriptional regulator